jgi:hypothetical protein
VIDWWRGSKPLILYMGTANYEFSMEDIEIMCCDVDRKVHRSNEIISVLSNELWHISKSMLPSAKGLFIYFSC